MIGYFCFLLAYYYAVGGWSDLHYFLAITLAYPQFVLSTFKTSLYIWVGMLLIISLKL